MWLSRARYEQETRIKSLALVVDKSHECYGEFVCINGVHTDASRLDNLSEYSFLRPKTNRAFTLLDDSKNPQRFIKFRKVSDLNSYLGEIEI